MGHKVVRGAHSVERSVTKAKTTRTTLRLFNIPQHNSWSARYHEFHAPPLPEEDHLVGMGGGHKLIPFKAAIDRATKTISVAAVRCKITPNYAENAMRAAKMP